MRGGAGDHNLLLTRLAGKVGGCNDKVKWMLWGRVWGGRCTQLFLSYHLVKLLSLHLSYTCRAQSQSRRRKHVLSLMTECQDCPCWGKEACSSPTTTSDTADLCKVTELRESPDINLQWDKDTTLSVTSRRNKGFSVTSTPSVWVSVEGGAEAPTIIRWDGV